MQTSMLQPGTVFVAGLIACVRRFHSFCAASASLLASARAAATHGPSRKPLCAST